MLIQATRPRPDGLQDGTPGTVAFYRIVAGARHQEVHVRLARKSKAVKVFAPCELVAASTPPAETTSATYENLSREEFRARLHGLRRVVVRVLAEP